MAADVVKIWYEWRDGSGTTATCSANRPVTTLATAPARAAALAAVLAGASRARLEAYTILWTETYEGNPPATTDVNPYGVFIFDTSDPEQGYIFPLPGILPALLVPAENPADPPAIDLGAPAVVAILEELLDGGWLNPFGQPLTGLASASTEIRLNAQINFSRNVAG